MNQIIDKCAIQKEKYFSLVQCITQLSQSIHPTMTYDKSRSSDLVITRDQRISFSFSISIFTSVHTCFLLRRLNAFFSWRQYVVFFQIYFTKNLPIDAEKPIKMNKFLSIFCLALFISASLAKKSATEQAADAAAELKDKVVEKVCYVYFLLTFH